MAAEYSGLGCTGAPVKWSQGSAGIMQRSEVTKSGITVGHIFTFCMMAVHGWKLELSYISWLNLSLYKALESSLIHRCCSRLCCVLRIQFSYPQMGAEYAGQPLDTYTIPKASTSCHDVLKQKQNDTSTHSPGICFGASAAGDGDDSTNKTQKH